MKITKVECIPTSFPLSKPFVMSGLTVTCINSVLLKLHTDEGIVGFGETGDISIWYQSETQDSVITAIRDVFAPGVLLGENPANIEKIVARMDDMARYNNQAKAVVDFALHDLLGKILGVPVYTLLGGRTVEKVPLMIVLGAGTPEELIPEARTALQAGFKSVKVKVGVQSAAQDIANVKAVRESLGPDVRIIIDANAAWNYFQALDIFKKLEPYDILMCEQPVPWWDIEGMARLRRQTRVPIFADESAQELKHVMELIHRDAVDGFLIKLAKVGGLLKGQKWVSLAKAAGLPVTSGCFKGSGIESATYAHFMAATEWMSKMEQGDLGPLENYGILDTVNTTITNDLVKELPRYENGCVYPPDGPGLGVELNEEVIARLISPGRNPVVITE